MNLDFLPDNLDGEHWEKLCDACYRDRYQKDNYVKVPATHSGDTGIEGFTHSGVVYQCYCPEKYYTDQELYEHLRDKVTQDVNKLVDLDNSERIKKLGVNNIREWHFVVPEYKDKRIIEHLETKRKEILVALKKSPNELSYIDEQIVLVIKTAKDFKTELTRCIINPLYDIKLNLAIKKTGVVDWSKCEAEKVANIRRKVKALMPIGSSQTEYETMVNIWAEAYLHGIEIMNMLQNTYSITYENLFELEQQYRTNVAVKSMLNPNRSLNFQLFTEILNDFELKLKESFAYFSETSIMEIQRDLVGGWLADCPLDFKE